MAVRTLPQECPGEPDPDQNNDIALYTSGRASRAPHHFTLSLKAALFGDLVNKATVKAKYLIVEATSEGTYVKQAAEPSTKGHGSSVL
jgi:hypothetical protein